MINQHVVDQMGCSISLTQNPSRIISLVPSQTELLYHLGLTDQVVGITKFCIHPKNWKKEKAIIGGTKNFNFDKIDALKPDLIIGNKEENYQEGIARLQERYPVWMSDVNSLTDTFQMISNIGEVTNRQHLAQELVAGIKKEFSSLQKIEKSIRVLYFIWKEPWMVAGAATFIDDMIQQIGLTNAAGGMPRYPIVDEKVVAALNPELIFLSSEPYPFTTQHIHQMEILFPNAKILLVDGEYFSWYGSRLLHAPHYFKSLLEKIATG